MKNASKNMTKGGTAIESININNAGKDLRYNYARFNESYLVYSQLVFED